VHLKDSIAFWQFHLGEGDRLLTLIEMTFQFLPQPQKRFSYNTSWLLYVQVVELLSPSLTVFSSALA
jgi:hypothetical protein